MPSTTRPRPILRRLAAAAAAAMLATIGLIGTPGQVAAAAHAVPWRFTTLVSADESIAAYDGTFHTGDYLLQCPAGYVPVSGGVKAGANAVWLARLTESTDTNAGGYYHVILINEGFPTVNFTIAVTCVLADDIGTITYVSAAFSRSAGGWAGGELLCPDGTTAFSTSVDWSVHAADRSINYSRPVTRGTQNGEGWYVAGYSPSNGATLGLSLRCVSLSLVTNEVVATADGSSTSAVTTAVASCPAGYRLLNGGVGPTEDEENATADQGWGVSGPYDYYRSAAFGDPNGVTFRAVALCVPSSTVSVQITDRPPDPSNDNTPSVTFTASDSAGEGLTIQCGFDSNMTACAPGTVVSNTLADGFHIFQVLVHNQYGSSTGDAFGWQVDTVAPTIAGHGSLPLKGPITITFSEPVTGVTSSSVSVHAETANVNVAGTIARPTTTTATWTPSAPLVPGETYRFSFTTAIHDTAGNAATATFFTVRASKTVENTSPAIHELWDLDNSALASGGSYIASRVSGSRADLTFTATAGQEVGVWGIRTPSGGNAKIYLDGVLASTPSFYASTSARSEVYLSGALTAGSHTISIRPSGTKPSASSGTWVNIDNLTVGATVKQESALIQRFRRVSSTGAFGGSYDLAVHTMDADNAPRYQATVVGTGVKVYVTKTATSGSAGIYVDGVLKATVSCYAASTTDQALVYTGTFAAGQHVIKIVPVGTSSGSKSDVDFDRLTVT